MAVTLNGSVLTAQALIGTQPRTLTWTSTVLTAGDIVVIEVMMNGAAEFSSPAAPTGGTGLSWAIVKDQQNTAAHFSRVTAYWSTIPSDQTSTITQVISGTGGNQHSSQGTLKRWSGADQVSPIGQTAGFQGQTDPTGTALQILNTLAGSQICMAASDWSAATAARTISISGTTGGVTDLDNLESGQFRAISARGAQSSSTNQGTLDYTAATGDWAAILYEIVAAIGGGAGTLSRHGPGHRRGPLGRMDLLRAYHHRRYSTEIGGAATFPVDVTDSAGLTDSIEFVQQLERTDSAGLTDTTAFIEALVRTDDAGLTDSATQALIKSVDATDSAGLTDTVAFTEAFERTDSAGLTDSALLRQELVRTDSAGLTDSSTIQVVKAVTADDPVGLTDTTAFTEQLVRTDSAGLTDQAGLTEQLVRTDSAGFTDTSTAGLLRDVTQTDLVGLTDSALFAELLIRTDLVGLTDTVQIVGGSATPKAGQIEPGTRAFAGIGPGLRAGAGAEPGTRGAAAVATGSRAGAQIEPGTTTGPSIEGGG